MFLLIETKLHQFSKFVLIVISIFMSSHTIVNIAQNIKNEENILQ